MIIGFTEIALGLIVIVGLTLWALRVARSREARAVERTRVEVLNEIDVARRKKEVEDLRDSVSSMKGRAVRNAEAPPVTPKEKDTL